MKGLSATAVISSTVLSIAAVVWLCKARGAVALAAAALIVVLASAYFRRRIGGINGDCFGATFQFVEIATYAVFLTQY